MSISGIGSNGAGTSNQLLLAMLSRLENTTSVTNPASTSSSTTSTASTSSTAVSAASSDTSLTGTGKGDLSAQILGLLVMMQNDPGASQSTAVSSTASSSSTSSSSSSLQSSTLSQLVSAIDTDGDGSISQGEMESYIEGKGGTQAQADALFSALNQNGSGNLTETQLASDLQSAAPNGTQAAHHHHHHHGGGTPSANDVASQLVQAMDTNGSGSVDQSEFENFVTSLGGTTAQADTDFAALNTQNNGSITANQLSSAITAFESAGSSQSASGASSVNPILTLLDDLGTTAQSGTTASA